MQPALQQLTTVATTGKAAGEDTGPGPSAVQERLAQQQVAGAEKQIFGEAVAADKEQVLKEQEAYMQLSDQAFQIREQSIQTKNKFQAQLDELLTDMESRFGQLNLADEEDRLEQMYQLARISNDKYINKLQLEGARSSLDNKRKFEEAMIESIFEENSKLLRDDISFKIALMGEQREFEKEIAQMDIDTAIRLLEGELEDIKESQTYTGLQSFASGAASLAAGYKSSNSSTPQPSNIQNSTNYGLGVDTSISEPAPIAPIDWSTYKFGGG
jgi:hypothetical protein